ncbi:MAG: hypothetical protein Q8L00_13475 [Deltaproteobacteria bacterium]|nr:hypothetical protein [Deltaproteobacteria bacterium]
MKRIPPSASATAIFAVQYIRIRTVIPGGMVFFTVTRLERRRERSNVKGGMRGAFPPYEVCLFF